MVASGDVRAADKLENDRADKAAEMGRLHLSEPAIDARRASFGARRHRYSTMLDLQKYIVAISRNVVNHDGLRSTALDAITWDKGGILKDYVISSWARKTSGQALGSPIILVVLHNTMLMPGPCQHCVAVHWFPRLPSLARRV